MPRRAASGPALDKLKKLMSSSLGKRASKILQASDDPVELVTRAAEQAVDEGLVEADSIDIPKIFSSQKDAKGQNKGKGKGKGKEKRKRSLGDVLDQGPSRKVPALDMVGMLKEQETIRIRKRQRKELKLIREHAEVTTIIIREDGFRPNCMIVKTCL